MRLGTEKLRIRLIYSILEKIHSNYLERDCMERLRWKRIEYNIVTSPVETSSSVSKQTSSTTTGGPPLQSHS